jgi:hypothetical protein
LLLWNVLAGFNKRCQPARSFYFTNDWENFNLNTDFCLAAHILYGDNLMLDIAALKECLDAFTKKVFYCGIDSGDTAPTVYASDNQTRIQLSKLFAKKAKDNASFAQIKIRTTRSLKLDKTHSLEDMLKRLPYYHIIFDPTATVERSSTLVRISKEARLIAGKQLTGCYFNSEKRNVHFFVRAKSGETPDLTAIRDLIEPILLNNTQRLSKPFSYSITISTQKPQGKVIAIDNASVIKSTFKNMLKSMLNKMKWPLLVASASSGLGMSSAANASLPAVSDTNGWLGVSAGDFHNNRQSGFGGGVEVGIAQPLGQYLGAQGRGYFGSVSHDTLVSVDGYIFWRNPAQGLIGPHVMYTESDNIYETLYGMHGEAYVNNLTVVVEGGEDHQNTRKWSGYGEAIVHWYIKPNWKVDTGYLHLDKDNVGQVGTEYQLGLSSLPGLSIFADAGAGSDSLGYGFIGLRYYFGDDKPLMRRHREDNVLPTFDLLVASHHHNTLMPSFHS